MVRLILCRVEAIEHDTLIANDPTAPVHDVETARLDKKNVEHVDIMQLAVADVNERWNRAAQVQRCMRLDGRLDGSKRHPVEQAQA